MNILSLFDGISGARIALEKLNIPITNYYASEIDKYAIQVSKENYPDIIHLGDIKDVKASDLPKIDLLIGGSPCQDLSNAQKGLGLKGEKSRLFYEYIRLYKELNPKYFLLENVKNKWGDLMSEIIGVDFIEINSSLFSAQSRPRYYWTNIKFPKLPQEHHSEQLEDIVLKNVDEKYYFNKDGLDEFVKENLTFNKAPTKDGIVKLFDVPKSIINDHERQRRIYALNSKSPTILARADTTKIVINERIRKLIPLECERLQNIENKEKNIIIELGDNKCLDLVKNYVNVVNKNPKLLKLVLSVEKKELQEYVNNAIKAILANHQLIKSTVLKSVDIKMLKPIKKCIKNENQEYNSSVNGVEKIKMFQFQKLEESIVPVNVGINLIEGRIAFFGKEELPQKDKNFNRLKNGKSVLKLSIKEIIRLVKDVENKTTEKKDIPFISITSYPLNQKNIEQILTILYYYAKIVTDGYIHSRIQIKTLSVTLIDGYTVSCSDTQRYKMIGNGFNVNTIVHILKGLENEPFEVRKKEQQIFYTKPQQPRLFA